MARLFGPDPESFVWATGIECTFVPQAERFGERALDEYELTRHYPHWREDLDLAAKLGVNAMRYGIPWYRVEASPGQFEWDWVDRLLEFARERDIAVIADLVHFGTPLWLDNQFLDSSYPLRAADYAAEFAGRYKDLVAYYTPMNSPSVTALICGDLGMWPPYLRGDDGAVQLIRPIARGLALTVEAIRSADPEAVIVSVDGALEFLPASFDLVSGQADGANGAPEVDVAGLDGAASPAVLDAARILTTRTFLGSDLVTGRVDAHQPLVDWLSGHGMTDAELAWHQEHAVDIDVVGLNYYPQFTVQRLSEENGRVTPRNEWGGVAGLERAVRAFASRYGKPVMITETDVNGSAEQREAWLRSSVEALPRMRSEGLLLVGYSWWPLFSLVDWGYRSGGRRFFDPEGSPEEPRPWSVESYLNEMGLFDLRPSFDGDLDRVDTPVADLYAAAIRNTHELLAPDSTKPSPKGHGGGASGLDSMDGSLR